MEESYAIRTSEVISFRDRLWSVDKYFQGTHRVTLTPVRSTENGRMYVLDGKPRVFKDTTVEREAKQHASFAYFSTSK